MAKKAAPKAAESKPEPKAEKPEPKGETSATIAAKKAESAAGKKEKSAPAAKAEPKPAVRPKAQTKSEIVAALAEKTGAERKTVALIFDTLQEMIAGDLDKKGPGVFIIPGMVKFKVVNKPATPERERRNPQTGEPMTTKAKPARNVVKAVLLKSLKDLAV